jgi:hypothetical protein
MKGWVYVISNPAMPAVVKIGYSMKDPSLRAEQLFSTGVPHKYTVEFEALVANPYQIEQKAHTILADFRIGSTEWFECDVNDAVSALREAASGSLLYVGAILTQHDVPKELSSPLPNQLPQAAPVAEDSEQLLLKMSSIIKELQSYYGRAARASSAEGLRTLEVQLTKILRGSLTPEQIPLQIRGLAEKYFEDATQVSRDYPRLRRNSLLLPNQLCFLFLSIVLTGKRIREAVEMLRGIYNDFLRELEPNEKL